MSRWRLHRGGIVNIWQYTEQTFDFSGGRAIFQGTNGSGKSRTLELLLPLCLDGDLRQLGSKGFDTVSIRRLMLDDYDGGPNRIGYAWIELTRDSDIGAEYLTCGLGVKASKTSQAITDSWRFVTSMRVGSRPCGSAASTRPVGLSSAPGSPRNAIRCRMLRARSTSSCWASRTCSWLSASRADAETSATIAGCMVSTGPLRSITPIVRPESGSRTGLAAHVQP